MPSSPSLASVICSLLTVTAIVVVGCETKTLSVGSNGCGAGTKMCTVNGAPACADTSDPNFGCARSNCLPCVLPNAQSICDRAGTCAISVCVSGYFDCDGLPSNGCEVNGNTDYNHCGVTSGSACTTTCDDTLRRVAAFQVASLKCSGGACVVDQCAPGWKDCNGAVTDGCERNVAGNTCGLPSMNLPCCGLCNGCPAGLTCDTTTNKCGSGAPSDGGNSEVDASIDVRPPPAPPGLAGFAFVVDGVVQTPMTCPSDNWEFAPPPAAFGRAVCFPDAAGPPGCPRSAILINTGSAAMAYIAHSSWNGVGYRPGVATGEPNELVGVLSPGVQVDITSVYAGGIVAVLGSANPFSYPDAGKYASDEGVVPWPAGVSGSGGAAQMQVAEIEIRTACGNASPVW